MRRGEITKAAIGYWIRLDESWYDPMWSWRPTKNGADRLAKRLIRKVADR